MPTALTPLGLASAIGSGVLYYAGAYWFYLGALRHVPASFAAVSFYLIPIVGVAAGALLLGERLDPRQWIGAVIVLGAILAIIRQPIADSLRQECRQSPSSLGCGTLDPPLAGPMYATSLLIRCLDDIDGPHRTRITGLRVAVLVVAWVAFVYVMQPSLGAYYEFLAALYALPPLGLVYAYCGSHRSRSTAILAVVATVVVVLLIGFAAVIPKGSAI